MELQRIGLLFSVLFHIGATEIPLCESVNKTTLCSLNDAEGTEGPPKPWSVKITLKVTLGGLIEVDERKNSLKVLLEFNQNWIDPRITVNSKIGNHPLHLDRLNDIWYNEPFFFPTVKIEKVNRIVTEKSSYL